jgi:hypothetical protein
MEINLNTEENAQAKGIKTLEDSHQDLVHWHLANSYYLRRNLYSIGYSGYNIQAANQLAS